MSLFPRPLCTRRLGPMLALGISVWLGQVAVISPLWAAGTYNPPAKFKKPAQSAPPPTPVAEPVEHNHGEEGVLGGPVTSGPLSTAPPRLNAQAIRPPTSDNVPPPGTPLIPGVTYAGATANATGDPFQPPRALGAPPFDLGRVERVRIGDQTLPEAPVRVGNLDILAPIVEECAPLGISVTQCAPRAAPVVLGVPPSDFFQINQSGHTPTVLAVGKASAWEKQTDGTFLETTLRSAPLVINGALYLPTLSLAQLVGAAPRLLPDGTLLLSPTLQSVEIFPVGNTVAVTIKTSAPVPPGAAQVRSMPAIGGNAARIYVDFVGFSMGFDAGNTTSSRLVANGIGDVLGARAGQPFNGIETTRVTLDLRRPLANLPQTIPEEPTLWAMILAQPRVASNTSGGDGVSAPRVSETPPSLPSSNTRQLNLKGMRIVVDAGHGDTDSGARGALSFEKHHTLDISKRLARELRARGAIVSMTRESDSYPTLQQRVGFANSRGADLFISVHMNASVNKSSRGTETFYYTGQSIPLARSVHPELVRATGFYDRGISQARFWVIRYTSMPSLLLECGFISNPREERIALDPKWRDRVALGVTRGISRWWENHGRKARD